MRIFVQLVLALIYIHSRKVHESFQVNNCAFRQSSEVLHRDLKPLNVFLTLKALGRSGKAAQPPHVAQA